MRRITPSSGVACLNFFVAMFAALGALKLGEMLGMVAAIAVLAVALAVAVVGNIFIYRKLDGAVGAVKYIFFSALPWVLWIFLVLVLG